MPNDRCTNTSGKYRCKKTLGHKDECEDEDVAPPWTFGPYPDTFRGKAYLRGRLDAAHGGALDEVGLAIGLPRNPREDDAAYRDRAWRSS